VKNHLWRPLLVALGLVAFILLLRLIMVPDDFGIHERGYMYGWYRGSNVEDWKKVPVKYRGSAGCQECHEENYNEVMASPHADIQCENCHGPRLEHPDNPEKLTIDRSRALCLRCHQQLPYPDNARGKLPGIAGKEHYATQECARCHNPHDPTQEVKR
jgi:predicted CXXCH cytochrome family protein